MPWFWWLICFDSSGWHLTWTASGLVSGRKWCWLWGGEGYGCHNLICLVADLSFQITFIQKRERESRRDIHQASANSALRGCSLTTLIVPCVDSSIHSFWTTRRALALIKECREVSYWTWDCFLIPGTLTILVNRNPIQLPAWAFFSIGFLLGLIFKVYAQMPGMAFSLFSFSHSVYLWRQPMPRATRMKQKRSVWSSTTASSLRQDDLLGDGPPYFLLCSHNTPTASSD